MYHPDDCHEIEHLYKLLLIYNIKLTSTRLQAHRATRSSGWFTTNCRISVRPSVRPAFSAAFCCLRWLAALSQKERRRDIERSKRRNEITLEKSREVRGSVVVGRGRESTLWIMPAKGINREKSRTNRNKFLAESYWSSLLLRICTTKTFVGVPGMTAVCPRHRSQRTFFWGDGLFRSQLSICSSGKIGRSLSVWSSIKIDWFFHKQKFIKDGMEK